MSLSSQKYRFGIRDLGSEIWDPGSGKKLFRIPGPGSRIQGKKGTGSRIRIRNTAAEAGEDSEMSRKRGGKGSRSGRYGGGTARSDSRGRKERNQRYRCWRRCTEKNSCHGVLKDTFSCVELPKMLEVFKEKNFKNVCSRQNKDFGWLTKFPGKFPKIKIRTSCLVA